MQKEKQTSKGTLALKIALLLNYLSKEDFRKFCAEIKAENDASREVSKSDLMRKYMGQMDFDRLKHNCTIFDTEQSDKRFGELCIAFGFLTPFNLELALEDQRQQADMGKKVPLGTILVDAGLLAKGERDLVIHKQKGFGNETSENGRTGQSFLQANEAGQGKQIPAKQPQSADDPDLFDISRFRRINELGLVILVRNDGLSVCLLKSRDFSPEIGVTGIRELLEKNNIIFGVVDDNSISDFIRNQEHKTIPFEVGKGVSPVDDTDGILIYTFERDYLKPGRLAWDGSMDFRERGEIPFVRKGDLLAEKIPPRPGKNGINVYGDTVPCTLGDDPCFVAGAGVRLSGDKLRAISDTDGNPKVNDLNEISVNGAYIIKGDVDFTTGHVKFDKNILITGTVKNGFRVEGIDVVANQVDGGSIKAKGDVFVQVGLIESTVEAVGQVKTGYVHRSKISCMGDITITKEMVDSEASLEGKLDMPRGRLFSSTVVARGGARIFKVGSEKTRPSVISVGTSAWLASELKRIEAVVKKNMGRFGHASAKIRQTEAALIPLQRELEDFEKSRQRTLSIMKIMINNPKQDLSLLNSSLDESEKEIHELQKEIERLNILLKQYNRDTSLCSEALKQSVHTKLKLKRIDQRQDAKPELEILGTIMARTRIVGPNTALTLEKTVRRARITELRSKDDSGARELVVIPR